MNAVKQWKMVPWLVRKFLSNINNVFIKTFTTLLSSNVLFVFETIEQNVNGVLQVVAVASLPKEIAAGLHPKQSNAIRGLLLQSGWVVEKLEDDSCVVTYVVQVINNHKIKMFF